jgi:hypothetical protein
MSFAYTVQCVQKCVETKGISVVLIRLHNIIVYLIKRNCLGMNNGVRKHKIEVYFTARVVTIVCCLLSAVDICCNRMRAIFDAREVGEERVQILLVVEF